MGHPPPSPLDVLFDVIFRHAAWDRRIELLLRIELSTSMMFGDPEAKTSWGCGGVVRAG